MWKTTAGAEIKDRFNSRNAGNNTAVVLVHETETLLQKVGAHAHGQKNENTQSSQLKIDGKLYATFYFKQNSL